MVDPKDLLAHAIRLLGSAKDDLDYRVIIDRAYYGAYHAAGQFEERLPIRSTAVVQKAGSHEALLHRLERPHEQLDYALKVISKDIGAQLRMLKPLRELASYDLGEGIRIDQAEEAIRTATDFSTNTLFFFRTSARLGAQLYTQKLPTSHVCYRQQIVIINRPAHDFYKL